jgi:hypothetical protein
MKTRNVDQISQVAHEANRAFCQSVGDDSQKPWAEAPQWAKDSTLNTVQFHLDQLSKGEPLDPSHSHATWLEERRAAGWVLGPVKDTVKKTHPSLVAFDQLSPPEKVKDYLQAAVVKAFVDSGL